MAFEMARAHLEPLLPLHHRVEDAFLDRPALDCTAMRYEFDDAGSSKFWEIVLEGKTFRVTWGRIGTIGQTQSKTFKTAEEAHVAHAKLVSEKLKKGYRVAGKPSKPEKTTTAKAKKATGAPTKATTVAGDKGGKRGSAGGVTRTAALIEEYSEKIKSLPQLELRPFVLRASSAAAVASVEQELDLTLPDDVKAFLTRGLKSVEGSLEEPYAHIGFDFLDAKKMIEQTKSLRRIVKDNDDDDADANVGDVPSPVESRWRSRWGSLRGLRSRRKRDGRISESRGCTAVVAAEYSAHRANVRPSDSVVRIPDRDVRQPDREIATVAESRHAPAFARDTVPAAEVS